MNIRKTLFAQHAAAALALAFPLAAWAVGIGEITLQSRLGEPLRAQVGLTAESSERIDDSCLSLLAPTLNGDDAGYITRADLGIKTEGGRQYISIATRKPLNEAFARLRLQVKCPGMGSMVKTFTVLPDLVSPAPQAVTAPPEVPATTPPAPVPVLPDAHTAAPAGQGTQAAAERAPAKPVQAAPRRHLVAHAPAPKKSGRPESFKLKLSGDPIDESRIGKIAPEERASLLAQKKLLDADDQMASFLALQHQVKQLQDELGAIKLQLAQLAPPASGVASAVPVAAVAASQPLPVTGSAGAQNKPKPAAAAAKPVQQTDSTLMNGLFAALGLLAVLALWLGLRRYTRMKSRPEIKTQQNAAPILKTEARPPAATPPAAVSKPDAIPPAPPKASAVPRETVVHVEPVPLAEEELSEEDSMLEEAKLYTAHGRPLKAVEILREITKRNPAKAEAWTLLLSLYSSLGKTAEFENAAREFHVHHKSSPAWPGIQALGRTLDPDNRLYTDHHGRIPLSPILPNQRRPIGDILMEMGALSKQDLQNCLDDYDPKKHGRFGGYLVARKAITLAQLDQALMLQQGVNTELPHGTLPSLQDMENFLADFDPQRDGSVSEFLVSRKAATPEQLEHLLMKPDSGNAAPPPQPAEKTQLAEPAHTLDFVLDSTPTNHALDLEFEPANEKDKPLDFEIELPPTPAPAPARAPQGATLDFPEIQLDFDNILPEKKADEK